MISQQKLSWGAKSIIIRSIIDKELVKLKQIITKYKLHKIMIKDKLNQIFSSIKLIMSSKFNIKKYHKLWKKAFSEKVKEKH